MAQEGELGVERFYCVEEGQEPGSDPNAVQFHFPFSRPLQPDEVAVLTSDLDRALARQEIYPKGSLRVVEQFVSVYLFPRNAQSFKDQLQIQVAALAEKVAQRRALDDQ